MGSSTKTVPKLLIFLAIVLGLQGCSFLVADGKKAGIWRRVGKKINAVWMGSVY